MRHVFAALAVLSLLAACATRQTPPHAAQLVAEFTVQDLAKSRAFYEQLGFRTTHQEKTFAELQWQDDHKLFLSQNATSAARPAKPVVNLRIGVADVDAHWKRAQGIGARVITPIGDRFYGERDFLIADPDGFGLRFAGLLPKGHW
jgi:uncharacterized glyoxalase superfamily protein PhnB